MEKRKHRRFENIPAKAIIRAGKSDERRTVCDITNLSLGGALVRSSDEYKVNQVIFVSFECEADGDKCSGQLRALVVRAEPAVEGFSIAFMFINPSKDDEGLMQGIITRSGH